MGTKDLNILGTKVITANNKKDISLVNGYNSYVQKIENICRTQKGEIPSAVNLEALTVYATKYITLFLSLTQ